MRSNIVFAALISLLAFSASAQQTATLYGSATGLSSGQGQSSLYTIDPATADATLVGPINDPNNDGLIRNVTGLAFLDDGRLVGSANGDLLTECVGGTCAALVEIDTGTGGASFLGLIGDSGNTGECGRMPDLTYDPTTRTLYGYSDNCNGDTEGLWTINPDGTSPLGTLVGPSGFTDGGNGLAREASTGTLFGTPFDADSLITIDPATGVGTDLAGATPFTELVNALAFEPFSGVLYGSAKRFTIDDDSYLVTINTTTGDQTLGGQVTVADDPLDGVDALVFQAPGGCTDAPLGSCTASNRAKLKLSAKKGQVKLDLKKLATATQKAEFGDPTQSTDTALCLYSGDAPTLIAGYVIPAGEAWKDQKKGFTFKSKTGDPDDITKAKLKEGDAGKGQASARGKGATLPTLPIDGGDVVGQIVNDVGSCFGATVSPKKSTKNTADKYNGQFKAGKTTTTTSTTTPTTTSTTTPTTSTTTPTTSTTTPTTTTTTTTTSTTTPTTTTTTTTTSTTTTTMV